MPFLPTPSKKSLEQIIKIEPRRDRGAENNRLAIFGIVTMRNIARQHDGFTGRGHAVLSCESVSEAAGNHFNPFIVSLIDVFDSQSRRC